MKGRQLTPAEQQRLDFLAWRAWNKVTDPAVRRIVYGDLIPKERDYG
jgi:hypothetical protein